MGMYQFGEIIKRNRENLGITQEELSDGICSVETLSRIENGKQAPSRTMFRTLINKMGRYSEKYEPVIHSNDMDIIMDAIDINTLLAQDKYEEANICLEHMKQAINLEDNVNRQYVLRMQTLVDYCLGKIDSQIEREQLVEAFLCTVPSYDHQNKLLPLGVYSRCEIMIYCNIAMSYADEDDLDTAIEMLYQAETYFNTTNISVEERAVSETLMLSNLGQCLGRQGNPEEAITVEEKGIKIKEDGRSSNLLDHLLYNIAYEKEILKENEETCKELLLQAYFVAELNGNKHMMNHIKKHLKKMYGDLIKLTVSF